MAFNGTEGGAISIELAAEMTAAFRRENAGKRMGLFMGKEILQSILDQTGCQGIRFYFAKHTETGENELVLVGADADGNDMLTIVADMGFPCPSNCSSKNTLNSQVLILTLISSYSVSFPALLALILYKHQRSTLKKLSVFLFIWFVFDLVGTILAQNGIYNLYLFHFHTYIELGFFLWIYSDILPPKKTNLLKAFAVIFYTFSIINNCFLESFMEFNSNQRYMEGIIIIIVCLIYFNQLFKDLKIEKLERDPYFLLTSSILIYFCGTLFLFATYNYVEKEVASYYWDVHSILNIIINCCYALVLWIGRKLT